MKKVIILHGTNGHSEHNWFPWLKEELEKKGWKVWVPDLPGADRPNLKRYNKFLFDSLPWELDSETILVGHSSGSLAALGLLSKLSGDVKVKNCYMVGTFKDDLNLDALKELFVEPLDFELLKTKSNKFTIIHSDDDPYCPLDHAEYMRDKLDADFYLWKGQKHFSISTAGEQYKKFPKLLELIIKNEGNN